jgi:trans-2,3-dihydro-3-hydroxyanthranilate isomerase
VSRVGGVPQSFRYVVADVFTNTPLAGNPVAVFTDAREIPEDMLQSLARELNLSETVFVYPPGYRTPSEQAQAETAGSGGPRNNDETVFVYPAAADCHARIRIFTPGIELPFAGHPVLGTAFVLGQPLQLTEIRLETGRGTTAVELEREGARITFGRMQQPLPTVEPFPEQPLLAAVGVERSELPVELYDNGVRHVYVALPSRDDVARLNPDPAGVKKVGEVCVNCFAGADSRWKTRMFAPFVGVQEDPATGSAAGPLAVHLARHGRIAWGEEIEIEQGAEIRRPSLLHAKAIGSAASLERVEVGGSAVVVARGEFRF